MDKLTLNFLPIKADVFPMAVYVTDGAIDPELRRQIKQYRLKAGDEHKDYSVSIQPLEGFNPIEVFSDNNTFLTMHYLSTMLYNKCSNSYMGKIISPRDLFRINRIEIITNSYKEGDDVIWHPVNYSI